jgi:hypothetical protein
MPSGVDLGRATVISPVTSLIKFFARIDSRHYRWTWRNVTSGRPARFVTWLSSHNQFQHRLKVKRPTPTEKSFPE